ncbi:SDR family NAD(P)-dependent oxidoreductase [Terracoccus sp. 273MFTsu3.1]|uniref:SDR family NAD(P)-dependent oxidoreductase n=1 Tax=Terracoccus sp. 273MFTsu3.1 TaxID=1172188 RepID=UPI00037FA27F|nr:SDR family NAD(P)-dependent oxidoreductase [Terracoccus sp. 273MFTsu3.1]
MDRQVALVTGATRGIGREVVAQLGRGGFTVIATGRSDADAMSAAAGVVAADPGADVRALGLDLDVADAASVALLPDAVRRVAGRLDVLVNNAAAFVDWDELGSDADLELARSVMETNLFGAWRVTQALLPLLRESAHARVVNVSSGAGSHGDEAFGLARRSGRAASYGVSKAALGALTSTLAAELDGTGILVNAVCPGLTATWPGAEEMGARPVSEGAASVVFAATLPDGGPSGGSYRDGRPLPW